MITTNGVRVCAVGEIADGEARVVNRDVTGAGDDIAVFHDSGEYFALDDTCTHEDASLAEGWIENCEVECPLHSARFSLRTGEALCLPATRTARRHRVEVRDGEVWLYPGASA